jgi:hypothetical protein
VPLASAMGIQILVDLLLLLLMAGILSRFDASSRTA